MTPPKANEFFGMELQVETVAMPKLVTRAERDKPVIERRMIAWDGEGMKLSGDDRPQHYVMFGCSADRDGVLISRNLPVMDILEYIIKIGLEFPNAIHVGYGFRYDANMIIKGLPPQHLRAIKVAGECRFKLNGNRWRIAYVPGKSLRITKRWSTGRKNTGKRSGDGYVSVKIDDMSSFFARPFLSACESILKDVMTDEDREVIEHGKNARKDNTWDDLDSVWRYWRAEIMLMEQMAVRFRQVMYDAGIMLREWYGPGAIASYLISNRGLRDHIQNEPGIPAVHEASKRAYAGGRFELFQVGRVKGPIFGLDINSAYPAALAQAPSLGLEHGQWVYVREPQVIEEFAVYRITYSHRGNPQHVEFNPMPLFFRDVKGSISFPQHVQGWYWSPEAANAMQLGKIFGGVTIHEGWVWRHDGTRPFGFLQEMFDKRLEIGKENAESMPFKLGPNSMYGKLAQRVGWDKKNRLAPKSHCLPLAGWITSHCRAQLFRVMMQMKRSDIIAVETDGIYTTADPSTLNLQYGGGLGEWGVDEYKEMMYLQSGVYNLKGKNGRWIPPKARGLDGTAVAAPVVQRYFKNCKPGTFPHLTVQMRERFVGLNAAMIRGRGAEVHQFLGLWETGTRDMEPGGKGKRIHMGSEVCPVCQDGASAWDAPHPLAINSTSFGELSNPHHLPWEDEPEPIDVSMYREMDLVEADLIVRDF